MNILVRALLLVAVLTALSPGARAFDAETAIRSVVSVLPQWIGRPPNAEEPEGTGVAVHDGRHILTANHVLGNARNILVRTSDGDLVTATIHARDPATDLALLAVVKPLPPLEFGSEPDLADPVCAIGNQFGLGLSVTCGQVSAVKRTGVGFNPIEDFIQTDAVVNPGASGGALFDEHGNLVGILSAIFTKRSDANIGVNFAVSAALAGRVTGLLLERKRLMPASPGWLLRPYPPRGQAGQLSLEIVGVNAGSAAAKAGLAVGDRIVHAGERRIRKLADMRTALALRPGDAPLELRINRGGEDIDITLSAANAKDDGQ